MEEISSSVAVPFTLGVGNLIQKESAVTTHMEITGLKLMANTAAAALILNPTVECCQSYSVGSESHADVSHLQHQITVSAEVKENQVGAALVSEMVIECESNWVLKESHNQARKEDEFMLAVDFECGKESASMKTSYAEIGSPMVIKVDDDIRGMSRINKPCPSIKPVQNTVSVAMDIACENDKSDPKLPAEIVDQLPEENKTWVTSNQNALELSSFPLWGCSSICGKRQEMEDAIAIKPQLLQVPSQILMSHHVNENKRHSLAHFFGVYDGHGGIQVANYCQQRLHSVLIEEINATQSSLDETNGRDDWQANWKKAFINCFQKVDDEVGGIGADNSGNNSDGSESNTEPVAPETAGSTAVVAILSQTHIVVANCGDSRAVLYRGKEAMPLSADHKPDRDDERARIEAAGGRVIHWKGYRVLGVLAMSRSIGDRYLKPWIIPEPEINIVHREKNDECLILASDGLWDVMTNEEVCEVARKRILLWHKKYGDDGSTRHGEGADPAAQSAAEYLSKLAVHRGSEDNISVIVIDLKPQRKIKRKA
ncbi:protein phosphatase 2C 50-like [Abrus precatorius]|uniref:protein-serine/threonine phosphatase n=1 Tax=Abrus precatorius TaxID=3816 RepID=A0A8B8JFU2_ABRPR|nr:protein phosphatase 2C 50-like [Abrus precatorius]XP_027330091.1 protein phosphatase 2C 50-like [Abrus precatorius]XP_027330092.1 protein phosphatase 2C 50-like [Abrus precatorius]XP_027330093.1 protein phosphatase 2C 50-like [Abrus precatorius]XP_027330094.1 protein phosphatase 2C 50-like [Abrus precatorius]